MFPFFLQATCSASIMDTPPCVCRCQPGEYISQVYPKKCEVCPAHLYSPVGEACVRCPPYGEPSLDRSTCQCAAGRVDEDLAEDTIPCVRGQGKGFNAQLGCYTCAARANMTYRLGSAPVPHGLFFCLDCIGNGRASEGVNHK